MKDGYLDASGEVSHLCRRDFFIYDDAIQGRIEVPVGVGKIQICVGDKIKVDEFGRQTRIPVYITKNC